MDYWIINLELFGEREEITLNASYSIMLKQKPYKSSFIRVGDRNQREQQAWDSAEEKMQA